MKMFKKIVALMAVVLMLCSIVPMAVMAADEETIKYTISSYAAGTQYKAETHELDDYFTVHTNTRCHFTTELRIYAPNGGVSAEVILESTRELSKVVLNAGNKASTLTVSTSTDNSTWTAHSTLNVASSYADLSIANLPAGTKYIKLVNGNGQVRVKYITVTYAATADEGGEEEEDCEHEWDDATCTKPQTCPLCGATEGEPLDHDYALTGTTDATCTEAGAKNYKCAACGNEMTETIPALGHDFSNGKNCAVCGVDMPLEATIDFSTTGQRTEYSSAAQKWENGGLVVLNEKDASTTNVGDYSNPVRFYKSSSVTISFAGMTSLVIDCSNTGDAKYSTPWGDMLTDAGYTYTVENKIYTVTFAEPVDSITLSCSAQVRANSITAYGSAKADDAEATFTAMGKSVTEEGNALAFRFKVTVSGMGILPGYVTQADYSNATITVDGVEYNLLAMGAVVTNGVSSVDIHAKYLYDLEPDSASFAVRIINIEEQYFDRTLTATPYFVIMKDGNEVRIEGESVDGSINELIG